MKYKGWAVRIANGKLANDDQGRVGPYLAATRREAQAWWNARKPNTPNAGSVERVEVIVYGANGAWQ